MSATEYRDVALGGLRAVVPGIALCTLVTLASIGLQRLEERAFAHPYVEALVIAMLLGMAVRAAWNPSERWRTGIAFSAKQLLEIAVMLLGASISFAAIAASGTLLLSTVIFTVVFTLGGSFGLSRLLGLPTKGADGDDVASSISFTAILGVLMVLGLPLLIPILRLSATQYGILAGLTVYAVPQVLAVTVPAGLVSTQIGTLVKLVRVLMLGPVVVGLSVWCTRARKDALAGTEAPTVSTFEVVPWFIIGFLVLAALRSFHVIPEEVVAPVSRVTALLTIVSMAALGLGVDVRVLSRVGGKVTAAVTFSLLLLLFLSIGLIQLF